jgi:hypothetical protein
MPMDSNNIALDKGRLDNIYWKMIEYLYLHMYEWYLKERFCALDLVFVLYNIDNSHSISILKAYISMVWIFIFVMKTTKFRKHLKLF